VRPCQAAWHISGSTCRPMRPPHGRRSWLPGLAALTYLGLHRIDLNGFVAQDMLRDLPSLSDLKCLCLSTH